MRRGILAISMGGHWGTEMSKNTEYSRVPVMPIWALPYFHFAKKLAHCCRPIRCDGRKRTFFTEDQTTKNSVDKKWKIYNKKKIMMVHLVDKAGYPCIEIALHFGFPNKKNLRILKHMHRENQRKSGNKRQGGRWQGEEWQGGCYRKQNRYMHTRSGNRTWARSGINQQELEALCKAGVW